MEAEEESGEAAAAQGARPIAGRIKARRASSAEAEPEQEREREQGRRAWGAAARRRALATRLHRDPSEEPCATIRSRRGIVALGAQVVLVGAGR